MNNRIKELAEISGSTHKQNLGVYQFYEDELENFSKLIIQECIAICRSRVGNSDYNTGRMHCVSDIKEHFGFE